MKINTLSYVNKTTGWKLEPMLFDQLTLLVGASGVGKTRILGCILDIKKIVEGASLNGVQWSVGFSADNGNQYRWNGEFENKGYRVEAFSSFGEEIPNKEKPKIVKEKLFINDKPIIIRSADEIIFNGMKTVKLSQTESAISLLKEEDRLAEVQKEFSKIIFDDYSEDIPLLARFLLDTDIDLKLLQCRSVQAIRASTENIMLKLYLVYKNQVGLFKEIEDTFIEMFPYVESIKIEPLITEQGDNLHHFYDPIPLIQIKEKGIEHWIDGTKLSSGMFRVLLHIAELHLCANASVILIDEFENSLGVNCIDELTSSIVASGRDIQFIITSHHPYIINNIHSSHWKIISRKAGVVIAHDASEFYFDKSKHKAFTQLINLDLYVEGANA